jgi:hypothetical protein
MNRLEKFVGSISTDDFILGLLHASKTNHLGEVWEKFVACPNCMFKEQCNAMTDVFEDMEPPLNPPCRDVINLLLGEISIGDIK